MEKEQPDSLATITVGSEKMPQTHSHYAPSEVYSSAEPPPAYMRPMKSTAVQVARIAAMTLITMSVILGSFILTAAWLQARASCTPESIAAMQAQLKLQEQQASDASQHHSLLFKRLRPEALVQEMAQSKDNLQSLSDSTLSKKDTESDAKDVKVQKEDESSPKADSESGDHDEDNDDDYDDDDFQPVHIKLPLLLKLDDVAGMVMQQTISCVFERRLADEGMFGPNNNNLENKTDSQRSQSQQEQEMLTPIIVPLGTVQIPLHQQEPSPGYHQYQVPDMQQLPLSDPRELNQIPLGILPPELRNLPQITLEMRPPRMGQHVVPQSPITRPQPSMMGPQLEIRRIPIEVHHYSVESMRAPMPQDPQAEQASVYGQQEQQDQQGAPMMPPPPPPSQPESQMYDHRAMPQMMIVPEKPQSPFQDDPSEFLRIIKQVPFEVKNIINHIFGEARPFPVPIPDGARRENVQEFTPFAENNRLQGIPIELKNFLGLSSLEDRSRSESGEEQQGAKLFHGPEDQGEEMKNSPLPAEMHNINYQVNKGRAFPVPRFGLPLRPMDSTEVLVEAQAEVADNQSGDQQAEQRTHEQQQQPTHLILEQQEHQQQQQQEQEDKNRPHYVQPRSVRSVNPLVNHRAKRERRCACDCTC